MKDIFIIIPTLNPNVEMFEPFLEKLQKEFKNILVVNDGCRSEYDSFFEKLEKKKVQVFHHYINLGKGRALKDAFNYILNKYPNIKGIVTADSDGQHSVKDIKNIAQKVIDNEDTLILGCRNFESENVPKRNRFGNKTTRTVLKTFVGINITDTQTGLRGLSKNVMVKLMDTKGERFEYETNQLIDAKSLNIPIIEQPIETIYLENSNSESHFNPIKDSISIYKIFLKYIFSSLSSFLLDIILFAILNKILFNDNKILIATIIARVISSFYNYLVNARVVFNNESNLAFIKYVMLVIIQMFISGAVVQLLSGIITSINVVIIKVIVDIIIFIVNFIVQREFIFVGKHEK